eukprot:scaffold51107_cov25-Attheya_sp.AAC.1
MDSQREEAALCLCRPKQPVGLVFWTEAGRAPTARVSPIRGCRSSPASGGAVPIYLAIVRQSLACCSSTSEHYGEMCYSTFYDKYMFLT